MYINLANKKGTYTQENFKFQEGDLDHANLIFQGIVIYYESFWMIWKMSRKGTSLNPQVLIALLNEQINNFNFQYIKNHSEYLLT